MPHIRPQRADILPAGLIVVDEACRLLGADAFTVSEADLLLGYLTLPRLPRRPVSPTGTVACQAGECAGGMMVESVDTADLGH